MKAEEELAIQTELRAEIAAMDEEQLSIMAAMVSAEFKKRKPQIVEDPDIRASEAEVRTVIDVLIPAFEARINDGTKKPLGYLDAFMGVLNFARLIIESLEREQGFDLDQKRAFRSMASATFHKSLMKRLEN